MQVFTEGAYTADWLIEEFGAPNFCRAEVTVLALADIPSGAVLGTATTLTTKYAPYDNAGGDSTGKAAAAAAILLNKITAEPLIAVSMVDAADVATLTFTNPHMLAVGDILSITGCTDAQGNVFATVVSVPTNKTCTIATSSVSDDTYAVYAQKVSHQATAIVKGPCVVSADGLDWDTTNGAGITTGKAELAALNIQIVEGV